MVKARYFEQFDYKSGAEYNNGSTSTKASGEEKMFGGVVGPPMCSCGGVPNIQRGADEEMEARAIHQYLEH